jgi:hypothetical protein
MSIVYCLYFLDSPNQEGQVPVFISPRNRVAQLYPREYAVEVGTGGIVYFPSFIKTDWGTEKSIVEIHRHTESMKIS